MMEIIIPYFYTPKWLFACLTSMICRKNKADFKILLINNSRNPRYGVDPDFDFIVRLFDQSQKIKVYNPAHLECSEHGHGLDYAVQFCVKDKKFMVTEVDCIYQRDHWLDTILLYNEENNVLGYSDDINAAYKPGLIICPTKAWFEAKRYLVGKPGRPYPLGQLPDGSTPFIEFGKPVNEIPKEGCPFPGYWFYHWLKKNGYKMTDVPGYFSFSKNPILNLNTKIKYVGYGTLIDTYMKHYGYAAVMNRRKIGYGLERPENFEMLKFMQKRRNRIFEKMVDLNWFLKGEGKDYVKNFNFKYSDTFE